MGLLKKINNKPITVNMAVDTDSPGLTESVCTQNQSQPNPGEGPPLCLPVCLIRLASIWRLVTAKNRKNSQ